MLLVVNVVSAFVHLYSLDYMKEDPHLARFMAYLSLFTFFMILLVTGKNFVILFLGWEGVGLCSYLLISFWYTRVAANKAATKALIVNRIADFALTLGIVTIFFIFHTLDFQVIFPLAPFFIDFKIKILNYDISALTLICSLLFIGAMGKSAQIGLHTWLPDAMEGPTPVSALIHAATMVTAGVFLVIKCSFLFEYVPHVLTYVAIIGALTAFFSATIGLVQNDIKKVIAYSTCSQLGYMIFACGLSNYHVAVFHLANHAFFKALLFLSAGAVIHSLANEQDMRKFGSLLAQLPFTAIMFLIGSFSLMGFPFLTGFYSKDLILEVAFGGFSLDSAVPYFLGLITAFFTSFYSFRVFYLTFIYKNNSFRANILSLHELPWKMAVSLGVLAVGSIFLGYLTKDLFVGLGTDWWSPSILILPEHNKQLDAEFFGLPSLLILEERGFFNDTYSWRWIKLLPFFFSLLAISLFWLTHSNVKYYSFFTVFSENKGFWSPKVNKILAKIYNSFFIWSYGDYNKIFFNRAPNWTYFFKRRPFWNAVQPPTDSKKLYETHVKLYGHQKTICIYLPDETDTFHFINKNVFYQAPFYYQRVLLDMQRNEHEDIIIVNKHQSFFRPYTQFIRYLYKFLIHKWYFDAIYNEFINRFIVKFSYNTLFSSFDKGLLEVFGPLGIALVLFQGAFNLKKMQLGRVYFYSYFIMLFLLISIVCTELS
jgi:proton-translocating NADH-quinone oxidoreductase chain L